MDSETYEQYQTRKLAEARNRWLDVHYDQESEKWGYGKVVCTFRFVNDKGELDNYGWGIDNYDKHDGITLYCLVVSCQWNQNEGNREPYAFKTEYVSIYSIDLEQAEMMVKTLRKVQKAVDKHIAENGQFKSFGQYAYTVARALGCVGAIFEGNLNRMTRNGQIVDQIDYLIARHQS